MDFKLVDVRDSEELPLRFVCVNPVALANMASLLHVDSSHKSFKIEARRFWPKDSGFKKPDPSALVKALEEIPNKGLVREVLFPILWQVGSLHFVTLYVLDQHCCTYLQFTHFVLMRNFSTFYVMQNKQ